MKIRVLLLIAVLISATACGKTPEPRRKSYNHTWPQRPVALVVAEWNGRPYIIASAFSIDESGRFFTAKHFTDELFSLGIETCTLFYNGSVYEASVAKIPPLRDAAALTINGKFDPSPYPMPYKRTARKLKVGEKVFIEGFHPHPFYIREANAAEGFPDTVISILKDYYGIEMHDKNRESEIVSDRLEARVLATREKIKLAGKDDEWGKVKDDINYYIKVKTDRNHKFSFGGLSGGPVTNGRGELIGLITAEQVVRMEFDDRGMLINPFAAQFKAVSDTTYVTPIEEILDLYSSIGN
ncbi:MAG: hypothetical protein AAB897_03495 [Patescibacteria group bacterium]